jgi:hypothetical protein
MAGGWGGVGGVGGWGEGGHPSQKKRAGRVSQGVGPKFKPQYHKKEERNKP